MTIVTFVSSALGDVPYRTDVWLRTCRPKASAASTVRDQTVRSFGMLGYLLAHVVGTGQQWRGAVASGVIYWRSHSVWVGDWLICSIFKSGMPPSDLATSSDSRPVVRHDDLERPGSKLGPWHSWICPPYITMESQVLTCKKTSFLGGRVTTIGYPRRED